MVKTQAYTCSHGWAARSGSQSAASVEKAAKPWLSGDRMMKFMNLCVAPYLEERS